MKSPRIEAATSGDAMDPEAPWSGYRRTSASSEASASSDRARHAPAKMPARRRGDRRTGAPTEEDGPTVLYAIFLLALFLIASGLDGTA